jgi:hypothetical protein
MFWLSRTVEASDGVEGGIPSCDLCPDGVLFEALQDESLYAHVWPSSSSSSNASKASRVALIGRGQCMPRDLHASARLVVLCWLLAVRLCLVVLGTVSVAVLLYLYVNEEHLPKLLALLSHLHPQLS